MSSGGSGSGTQTVVNQSQPPQQFLDAYTKLVQAGQAQAQQPLQQYGGPMVAGFTPQQQQAFQTIQNAQGLAQPYINAGASLIGQSAAPISPNGLITGNQLSGIAQQGLGYTGAAANTGIAAAGQPGISSAMAAASTDPNNVSKYLNPYTQNVVNATQAQFNNQNAQAAQGVTSQAIKSGAFGGDRADVAQAILAGQEQLAQAPVIAGIQSQGYAQAQQAMQQQAALEAQTGLSAAGLAQGAAGQQGQLGLSAAQQLYGLFGGQQQAGLSADQASAWLGENAGAQLAGLGTTAENAALTGASANLQAGASQQALAQQQLNIPYQQFQAQQAYPFQTLNFLAGLASGAGSNAGGTSSTSSPGPSLASQLGGAGIAGVGLLGQTGAFGSNGYLSGLFSSGAGAAGGAAAGSAVGAGAGDILETGASAFAKRGGAVRAAFDSGGAVDPESLGLAGASIPDPSVVNIPSLATVKGAGVPKAPAAAPADDPVHDSLSAMKDVSALADALNGKKKSNSGYASGGDVQHTNSWMAIPGQIIGTGIGAFFGGPAGGAIGGVAGKRAGFEAGDLFGGNWKGLGVDLQGDVQQATLGTPSSTINLIGGGNGSTGINLLGLRDGGRVRRAEGGSVVQGQLQKLLAMPDEHLREMAIMAPPDTPQGALIQRALLQKQMMPANDNDQGLAATGTYGPAPTGLAAGGIAHMAAGGSGGAVSSNDDATSGLVAAELGGGSGLHGSFTPGLAGDLGNIGYLANQSGLNATTARAGGVNALGSDATSDLVRAELGGGSGASHAFTPGLSGDLGNIGYLANKVGSGAASPPAIGSPPPAPSARGTSDYPNMNFVQGARGISIPQVTQSLFGVPQNTTPGSGLPGWLNPLDQYHPANSPIVTQMPKGVMDALNPPPPPPPTDATGTDGLNGAGPKDNLTPDQIAALTSLANAKIAQQNQKSGGRTGLAEGGTDDDDDAGLASVSPVQIAQTQPSVPDAHDAVDVKGIGNINPDQYPPVHVDPTARGRNSPATNAAIDRDPTAPDYISRIQQTLQDEPGITAAGPAPAAPAVPQKAPEYQPGHPSPWMALLTAGAATMAGKSPFALSNLGQGILAGAKEYQHEDEIDAKPEVDHSGETVRIYYPSEKKWIDTGLPTNEAQRTKATSEDAAARLAQTGQLQSRSLDIQQQRADTAEKDAAARLGLSKQELALKQEALAQGRFSVQPGVGPDPADPEKQVAGSYRLNGKTGDVEFLPGTNLTGKPSATSAQLSPDAIDMLAKQTLAGDTSGLSGLGFGNAGATNRAAVRERVAVLAKERGLDGSDLAAINAGFFGTKAGERTLGTRTANIGMAVNEAKSLMPLALDASAKVDRTQFPTLNAALQAAERGTGGEDVVRLGIATNSLINAYARGISPTGVPTVSDKDHARELLSAAWSKGQYSSAVDQLMKELNAAATSPGAVREEFRGAVHEGQSAPALGAHSEQPTLPTFSSPTDPGLAKLPSGSAFYAVMPDGSKRLKYAP